MIRKNSTIQYLAKKQDWTTLILLTVLGAFLRFYDLGEESIWMDEAASWRQSNKPTLLGVVEGMRDNVHPPGWVLLIHLTQQIFGSSEFALRLPSAIAGTLSIPAIFYLGRYLHSSSAGLFAAGLLATLLTPINYSQGARAYSLLILIAILSFYFLLLTLERIEKKEMPWGTISIYVILCTALSYLHYSGLLLVMIQAGVAVSKSLCTKKNLTKIISIFLIILLLYSPWLFELFTDLNRSSFSIGAGVTASPRKVLNFFFFREKVTTFIPFLLIATYLSVNEIINIRNNRTTLQKSSVILLIAWLILPYLAFYLKSLSGAQILVPRYFLVSAPAAYLLIGIGITRLVTSAHAQTLILLITITASLWVLLYKWNFYLEPQKPQIREVIKLLNEFEDVELSNTSIVSNTLYVSRINYYLARGGNQQKIDFEVNIPRARKNKQRTHIDKEIELLKGHVTLSEACYFWVISLNSRKPRVLEAFNKIGAIIYDANFYRTNTYLVKKNKC